MFNKSRKIPVKNSYVFIIVKSKSLRTIRIKGHDLAEAEEKVKQKYPGWIVSRWPVKNLMM